MIERALASLRIYVRRLETTVKGRRKPLVVAIIDAARDASVDYASAMYGQDGFSFGDASRKHLPVCVELVAAPPLLERFVREHQELLAGTTIMLTAGTRILTDVDAIVESAHEKAE